MDRDPGPIMIIYGGTQKAGSSWIHRALSSDPSLARGRKEWHYWRSVGITPDARLADLPALDATALHQQRFVRPPGRDRRSHTRRLGWWSPRTARPGQHRSALAQWVALCRSVDIADFTPANILLSESQWSEIAVAMPEARIVVSIRDPVLRAWSQIRKDRRRRPEAPLDDDAVIRAALSPSVRRRSLIAAKVRMLKDRWPGQVLVTTLDDISEDPATVVAELARFAGARSALTAPGVVNAGVPREMPRAARAFLEREWASELADPEDIAGRTLRC